MKKAIIIMKKDIKEIRTSFQIFGTMIATPALLTGIALVTFGILFAIIPNPIDLYSILYGAGNILPMYNLMFLIIPVVLPTYIAADSFVGEKVRKTIEALLVAPISDNELLLGKVLVSLIPTLLFSYLFIGVYIIGINILQLVNYGAIVFIFPDLGFILGCLLHIPLLCIITIEIMVIISLKVKGIREAQQIGGVVVIPVISFMFLPFAGLNLYSLSNPLNIFLFTLITLIFCLLAISFYFLSLKVFKRSNIIVKI
ncbi:MAG: hypothetical protein ACTSWR_11700 [Candidatus Helarchaeota archaeon]